MTRKQFYLYMAYFFLGITFVGAVTNNLAEFIVGLTIMLFAIVALNGTDSKKEKLNHEHE